PRLPGELRGEAPDVAGPYLVARCARPGAHGGLGDPRGRAAEARRVRVHPLLAADLPRRIASVPAADVRPEWNCGRLHEPRRPGAARHEEADRLLIGRAHGLCDLWPV